MTPATAPIAGEEALRFGFGANWRKFLAVLTEERIAQAEASLAEMLEVRSLEGRTFLDIGCGSGLFSLAARRLGAEVRSFDFDPDSVACSNQLKQTYFPGDERWQVSRGSILDLDYVRALGRYDVVYSWGVLHHTGQMWQAIENAASAVVQGGTLFIAIYNDQGAQTTWWRAVKRTYNRLPTAGRLPYALVIGTLLECAAFGVSLARLQPRRFFERWTSYHNIRGMSRWHDMVDWIGGFPFEVATPEAVFDFCVKKDLILRRLKTCGGKMGCNEFVFEKGKGSR